MTGARSLRELGLAEAGAQFARVLAVMTLGWPIALLLQIGLARLLGATEYGLFAYLLAIATVAAIFCRAGLDGAAVHFIPTYRQKKDAAALRRFITVATTVAAGLSLAMLAAFLLLALSPVAAAVRLTPLTAAVTGGLVIALSLLRLWQSIANALRRHARAQLADKLLLPSAVLACALVLAFRNAATATTIMFAYAAVALLLTLLLALSLTRDVPPRRSENASAGGIRLWMLTGAGVVLMSGSQLLIHNADVIMLGAIRGPLDAGFYAAAALLGQMPGFGATVANLVAGPRFTAAITTRDDAQLRTLARFSVMTAGAVAAVGFIALVVIGRLLLGLYGPGFSVAWGPLLVIGAAMLVNVLCGSVGTLLVASGRSALAGRYAAEAAVANLVLNAVLIPSLGMHGAALATATCIVFWNLRMRRAVIDELGIEPSILAFRRAAP